MSKAIAVTVAAVVALGWAGSLAGAGSTTPALPRLDAWVSLFAMRQVTVDCPSEAEWSADASAHGLAYVPVGPPMTPIASRAVAAPVVCAGALAVAEGRSAPPWDMAVGVLALVHEAYHLRIWAYRFDEGRVNCQAIRHFKVAVELLGGSWQLAEELLPYALAIYWRLAVTAPRYHWKRCGVPRWSY